MRFGEGLKVSDLLEVRGCLGIGLGNKNGGLRDSNTGAFVVW